MAFALLVLVFAAAFQILSRRIGTETGQLAAGEASGQPPSLDLRSALKASYPSEPLSIVHDLGANNGIDKKIFSYKVIADGLTEYGLEVVPQSNMPKSGWPTIILCHGYEAPSHYMTTRDYLPDMVFFAQHGFLVVKPDYRGQGLSLHQGQANSAYYSMSYNTDVMSLITALKSSANIDKSNLNLFGHSMGAYIALRAAVLSPAIKNLILLSGPVDSLSKMYLTYIPPSDVNNLNALKTRNDVFSKYGIPATDTGFWKYASPINLVSHIKAHVQIHVGSLDQTVPPEFSADLDAALSQNHIKHEYYIYPDGSHSLGPQRPLLWSRALKVLQPAAAPIAPSV